MTSCHKNGVLLIQSSTKISLSLCACPPYRMVHPMLDPIRVSAISTERDRTPLNDRGRLAIEDAYLEVATHRCS